MTVRVLQVIARMNVGGPARMVCAAEPGLATRGVQSRLVTGDVAPGEVDELEFRAADIDSVRISGLGRDPRPGADVRALFALAAEMRRFRPHIVHTHTAKAGVLGRLAARAARVPVRVHTFHGHLLHGYFGPATTRAVIESERALARITHRLLAVGDRVRDDLLAAGVGRPDQWGVMPPGLDLPEAPTRAEARARLGVADAPTVAFVGRLVPIKRPDRFATVARTLAARDGNVRFLVAGSGTEEPSLRVALGPLGDRVSFLGWRADIETVHSAADVVMVTSDNEGMPVALIEAAMCGTPGVTTDVGSAGEVVVHGETGFVTAPTAEALAEAAAALLGDRELRRRMGDAARERARGRYSAAALVSSVADLYHELADGRGTLARAAG